MLRITLGARAAYPITIDPRVTNEDKKLTASHGLAGDRFAPAAALSGDALMVGAYGVDSSEGSAGILTRDQDGANKWGQSNKLAASGSAVNDKLGMTLGQSCDTPAAGTNSGDCGQITSQAAAHVYNWQAILQDLSARMK